jgi:hypothetical protein
VLARNTAGKATSDADLIVKQGEEKNILNQKTKSAIVFPDNPVADWLMITK